MIEVLGIRRIVIVAIMVAVNAVLGAGLYLYAMPESEKLERDLRSVRGQIGSTRGETETLRSDYELIQRQRDYFEELQDVGFINDQNRLLARRRIAVVREYTRVLNAEYNISPAQTQRHDKLRDVGHHILSTSMSIQVEALDDIDLYNFIYWMENGFPGHVSLERLSLERLREMNDVMLRQMGSGTAMPMVRANMTFSWRTMMPSEADAGTSSGGF